MTGEQAIAYINEYNGLGSKPGLSRTFELLEALGNPQERVKYVHIAGTNGKGSTAAMTASVLTAAGCKTGLYTSPYLLRFTESISIDGKEIDPDEVASIVKKIKIIAEKMSDHPTVFEMKTALAFEYFYSEGCDIAVCEVGMGGRLDSTNVIPHPMVSVITNIGLDHTQQLGATVELIALEKAGIIKPNCEAVLYGQKRSVEQAVRGVCDERGAKLTVSDGSAIIRKTDTRDGQIFDYKGFTDIPLPLLGENQRKNAAVVLETVLALRRGGIEISDGAVRDGIAKTAWPGRFEVVSRSPFFIVDGGHNPQCAQSVAENLNRYFPEQKAVFLIGMLADKDYRTVLEYYYPLAESFVCVTPNSTRALPACELAKVISESGASAVCCGSIADGVEKTKLAAEKTGLAIATGSLYMIGVVRECFGLK